MLVAGVWVYRLQEEGTDGVITIIWLLLLYAYNVYNVCLRRRVGVPGAGGGHRRGPNGPVADDCRRPLEQRQGGLI